MAKLVKIFFIIAKCSYLFLLDVSSLSLVDSDIL